MFAKCDEMMTILMLDTLELGMHENVVNVANDG